MTTEDPTTRYDTVISNGIVVYGLGNPRHRTDVGITCDRITKVGRINDADAVGAQVLDATGLIVAPGFIDLHTHYDAQIRWDPWCTISGYHGVTSVVLGNCGFGFAPVKPDFQERSMLTMTRTEAIPYESMKQGMAWDWETIPEYLDSLDRQDKGVNCMRAEYSTAQRDELAELGPQVSVFGAQINQAVFDQIGDIAMTAIESCVANNGWTQEWNWAITP